MTPKEMYAMIKHAFGEIIREHHIADKTVSVRPAGGASGNFGASGGAAASGKSGEGPGNPAASPLRGAEYMLRAEFEGSIGECSTVFPGEYRGTLGELSDMDIENDPVSRSLYIAALNAVMNRYELADDCVSCSGEEKEACAEQILSRYKRSNGKVNFLLAGCQPHMIKALSAHFPLRVLDLNTENIGKTFSGIVVEDGEKAYADATRWAQVVLCTGSSLTNGSITDYIRVPKDVAFYGTTVAGAARILELRRVCPFSRNS